MKLKALDILNILVKENFTLEIYSTDHKSIIMDKKILKEAISELKSLKNKKEN